MSHKIDLERRIVVMTAGTVERILGHERGADALALYTFRRYAAKHQASPPVEATPDGCQRALRWTEVRFKKADSALRDLDLAQKIPGRHGMPESVSRRYKRLPKAPWD